MKIFTLLCLLPVVAFAQTTPSQSPYIGTATPSIVSVGDTMDFEQFPSGTIITNQYQYLGILFSGYNGSGNPDVYDYGPTVYTKILKSDNWYNPMKLTFVDPLNPTAFNPVQYIDFDNSEDAAGDWVIIDVYDSTGAVVYHGSSFSPDHVSINLGSSIGAYMVLDDSLQTAYIIDNILLNLGTSGIGEIQEITTSVYPNPFRENTTLSIGSYAASKNLTLDISDATGKMVYHSEVLPGSKTNLNLATSPGFYIYKITDGSKVVATGKMVVM
jgi:hypothetical protein